MQEEFEYIKEVTRAVYRRRTDKEEIEDTKGVIRCRTPKKDMQEEFEYIKGVTRAVHRRRTDKKSLQIEKE